MAKKQSDYLSISAKIRYLELSLLSRERMERMLDARTDEEAFKVLAECGYSEPASMSQEGLEAVLRAERLRVFDEFSKLAPHPAVIDVFRIKYDYHNIKTLIKGKDPKSPLLIDSGRIIVENLAGDWNSGDFRDLPPVFAEALADAQRTLAETNDPQLSDLILDKAYFSELLSAANSADSDFLKGYVRLLIDSSNLRTVVRISRMKKSADFLQKALVPGGNVPDEAIFSAFVSGSLPEKLEELFAKSELENAMAAGINVLESGALTYFEKLCDDAAMDYVKKPRFIGFGEEVLIGYLAAKDAEVSAARIILSGRMAGVASNAIRERLREAYV